MEQGVGYKKIITLHFDYETIDIMWALWDKWKHFWNHHPRQLLDQGFIILCRHNSFNLMNGAYI